MAGIRPRDSWYRAMSDLARSSQIFVFPSKGVWIERRMQEVRLDSFRGETRIDGIYQMTKEDFGAWIGTVDSADLRGIFIIEGKQFSITEFTITYTCDIFVHLNIEARSGVWSYAPRAKGWDLEGSSYLVRAANS